MSKKSREDLKILLMQARNDAETIKEEIREFAHHGGLREDQFQVLNLFDTPVFEPELVDPYDALFIGGSSDASVVNPEAFPFVKSSERMLKYCVDTSKVVFASCFGFQVVTVACGGKVINDVENMEMGIYEIHLTPEARHDPLFFDMPERFWAVSGHQDRAAYLPEGFLNMGHSERCPFHIMRVEGKPFYGCQFHPEVDYEDFVTRITRYQDRYDLNEDDLIGIRGHVKGVPESNELIRKFVDRIILGEVPESGLVPHCETMG